MTTLVVNIDNLLKHWGQNCLKTAFYLKTEGRLCNTLTRSVLDYGDMTHFQRTPSLFLSFFFERILHSMLHSSLKQMLTFFLHSEQKQSPFTTAKSALTVLPKVCQNFMSSSFAHAPAFHQVLSNLTSYILCNPVNKQMDKLYPSRGLHDGGGKQVKHQPAPGKLLQPSKIHRCYQTTFSVVSAAERQHPLRLRCGRRREGGADRGGGGALGRPVAHAAAAQERLVHRASGGSRPAQSHPARHPGLWRSRCSDPLARRDPARASSAENWSR